MGAILFIVFFILQATQREVEQQLRAASIEVRIDPQVYPNGRFARLQDPEGNPIELWELT